MVPDRIHRLAVLAAKEFVLPLADWIAKAQYIYVPTPPTSPGNPLTPPTWFYSVRYAMTPQDAPLSKVVPSLVALLVCDVAVRDPHSGKSSLLGIFDRIISSEFPAHRQMGVYAKFTDALGAYKFRLRFMEDESDREIASSPELPLDVPDRRQSFEVLLPTPLLELSRPGRYRFDILMNGVFLGSTFLDVESVKRE